MRRPSRKKRGVVLILVLLILTLVVALALALARETGIEVHIARQKADAVRLRAMTGSAVERAMAAVRLDQLDGDTLFDAWRDDEALFAGFELDGGRAWLLVTEPDPGDGREVRYGVRDEASKLDVNIATRDQLLALPGITEEAADGIVDWIDEDEDVGEFGAESITYEALEVPYTAKNAPVESLDELLRVNGVDELMLYGEDRNRNGVLDPGEDDGDGSFPPDDADGELDRGLIDYLTVFARDLNRTQDNQARLVWNDASREEIEARLSAAGLSGDLVTTVGFVKLTASEIDTLGELVVRIGSTDADGMAIVLDELTVSSEDVLPGRINVNTAPREVLLGFPTMDEELVDAIMTYRSDPSANLTSPAWLLNVISPQEFAGIVDSATTRSYQFTVHAVALLDDRPRFQRVEVLIDRSFVPVRVLLSRDVTTLGFPFPEERGEDLP